MLDLPCGPGRHALEFARAGCQVTGVDRTTQYLDEARRNAEEAGLDIEFVQSDMRDFLRPEAYNLAISLYTAFGYFKDQVDDLDVLGNFYASLRPGGVLIIDILGKEVMARTFKARDWRELKNGALLLEEHKVLRNWTWAENRWILMKDNERREFTYSHRLYSATELEHLLVLAGFVPVEFFGSLAGTPYDQDARRLVAVAHRK